MSESSPPPKPPDASQPKGKPVVKSIVVQGDLGPGQTISIGTGNMQNGQLLENPTLPPSAVVTVGDSTQAGDLDAQIRAQVQAKLREKGITSQGQEGISIGGRSENNSTIIGNNMNVDASQKPANIEGVPIGTERTLPFKMGTTIRNGSFNGMAFEGEWTLRIGPNGQFIYVKTK